MFSPLRNFVNSGGAVRCALPDDWSVPMDSIDTTRDREDHGGQVGHGAV
jgi:hypothetical protein